MENKEMNLNEMEEVVGGLGGSREELPEIAGLQVYRIVPGDTLSGLAIRFRTTEKHLMKLNWSITNANDITPGFYIYIPQQH